MTNTELISPGEATGIYARKFYDLLFESSTEIKSKELLSLANYDFPQGLELPETVRIFAGSLTTAFSSLKISQTYYTRIKRILTKYGCVTYLQRGTRSYDSVLLLNHPPPEPQTLQTEDLTPPLGDATLQAVEQRTAALEHTVEGLENWREGMGGLDIVEMARNYELRILALERQLGIGENGNGEKQT